MTTNCLHRHPTASPALPPHSVWLACCYHRWNRVVALPMPPSWSVPKWSYSDLGLLEKVASGWWRCRWMLATKLGSTGIEGGWRNPDHRSLATASLMCDRGPRLESNLRPLSPAVDYPPPCSHADLLTTSAIAQSRSPTLSHPPSSKCSINWLGEFCLCYFHFV
jgi:hypothetical protein